MTILDDEEREARKRLQRLVDSSDRFERWSAAVWQPSNSNDAWRLGDEILRVCWRGDARRLTRESVIARALPPAMLHPTLLAEGNDAGFTWQRTRRVVGEQIYDDWHTVPPDRLRCVVNDIAGLMRTLHSWTPPTGVVTALHEREGEPQDLIGTNLLPIPVARLHGLFASLHQLEFVEPDLLRSAERRVNDLASIDPFRANGDRVVVHGDAQFSNVIVDGPNVVALFDYEWCRLAPSDAELAIWIHVIGSRQRETGGVPPVWAWLREDYPSLFAHPDFEGRMWLYALAFYLRGLLVWPPDAPEDRLDPTHHLHALRAIVERPPLLQDPV